MRRDQIGGRCFSPEIPSHQEPCAKTKIKQTQACKKDAVPQCTISSKKLAITG